MPQSSALGEAAAVRGRPVFSRIRRLQAPQALRALVRANEIVLAVLAALIGCAAGGLVVAMNSSTQWAHEQLFGLAGGERLSAQAHLEAARILPVLVLGGLVVGLFGILVTRLMPRRAVDPIEANALYGGQMSLKDSLVVVVQTMLSNAAGASVGLEAGYTQIGSAVASRIGRLFRLRRADLRVLVGCGAAGAIAAAFNAPLTGAFYGFELVIGTYTLVSLAPVVAASICAVMVQRVLVGEEPGYDIPAPPSIEGVDFIPVLSLGVAAALMGIAIMYSVTLTERVFTRSRIPAWLRPAVGGLGVAMLALVTPAVLSSGHGALRADLSTDLPWRGVVTILLLKSAASALSLGSGFRGGLFFASLFLGAMLGKAFAALALFVWPIPVFPDPVYGLIGMSGMAVAIVGGPLTMAFLALESTGSFPLTSAVLAAAVVSSLTVRRTFGYSFATWRFHLRGETIRSAVDIGWIRNLTVGRMMRRDVRPVAVDTPLAVFRREYPLGSTKRVIVTDAADRYAGIVWVDDAHAATEAGQLAELLHHADTVLLPEMTAKEAAALFESAEADALAVVQSRDTMRVLGLLTEQYLLRRYAEELERRGRDLSGEP